MNKMNIAIVTGSFLVAAGVGSYFAATSGGSSNPSSAPVGTASSLTAQPTPVQAVSTSPTALAGGSCTLNESGSDVEVTLNQDQPACTRLGQTLAQDFGGFWQLAAEDANLQLVCALSREGETVLVIDSGMHIEGSGLCRTFQAEGYVENLDIERSYVQAQVAASASAAAASASAAEVAARASQQAADYQGATQELSALQQATGQSGNVAGDVSTLGKDTGQAATDLAKTKSDAAQGQGDYCYGVTTVYYDAVNTVGYDENETLGYDLKSLAGDIANVRDEEDHLNAYTTALQNEGVTPPAGIPDAIAAAQQAISSAITQANSDIDAVASDTAQAYQLQNAMVTGACSTSTAAGDPPTPPAYLS